jgi:MFS transporter, ACS family, pantothenate transporter
MGSSPVIQDNVKEIDTAGNELDNIQQKRQERALLLRLDVFILSWACFGYFVRILDYSNMANAYVSGLKEDLNVQGDQYNLFSTLWTCGYIIGQIPSQLVITKIRPSIWIPCAEVLWAIFSFSFAAVNSVPQVYALRFLIGVAESPFYVGAMTLLGNWYTPKGTLLIDTRLLTDNHS